MHYSSKPTLPVETITVTAAHTLALLQCTYTHNAGSSSTFGARGTLSVVVIMRTRETQHAPPCDGSSCWCLVFAESKGGRGVVHTRTPCFALRECAYTDMFASTHLYYTHTIHILYTS
jgi:hypothetical protein